MTAINAGRQERRTVLLRSYVFSNDRQATDRYWTGIFVVIFILWMITTTFYDKYEMNLKTNLNNSATLNNFSSMTNNASNYKIHADDKDTANVKSEYVSQVWGKNWIFDTVTCNVGFLDVHYKKNGPIVIWSNVVFCVCLFIYAYLIMPKDRNSWNRIAYFGDVFMFISVIYRFIVYFLQMRPNPFLVLQHENAVFWVLPELIIFFIRNTGGRKDDNDGGEKIILFEFVGYAFAIRSALFAFLLLLIWLTIGFTGLNWSNPWSFPMIGATCYIGLTIFNFGLMVIAYATGVSLTTRKPAASEAQKIVKKYHFGTACYRATLVLPKLHAAFVMHEKEFKERDNFSIAGRFNATYCKIQNFSSVVTAVRGHHYSESIRESLRLYASDSPKLKDLQAFTRTCKSFFAIFMAFNGLIFTFFWSKVSLDPHFVTGTWWIIFTPMMITYFWSRADDAIADAIWLCVGDENVAVTF